MIVHHLNCATFCALGGRLMDGISKGLLHAHLVCHCLLVETGSGLVLIDTGLGMGDIARPRPRLSSFFLTLMQPPLRQEETAVAQVRALGFQPEDVRHIVLTHLDFDHAGGIGDFPQAQVHVLASEREAATHRSTFIARRRYRPEQFARIDSWHTYTARGERWMGFDCVRDLAGLPPEILLVPLAGHTYGHAGIAVDTATGWLLHAGDAYFYRGEMEQHYSCTPGLRFYQRMMEVDRTHRRENQRRLRELVLTTPGTVRVFSAHDPVELHECRPAAHDPIADAGLEQEAVQTAAHTSRLRSPQNGTQRGFTA